LAGHNRVARAIHHRSDVEVWTTHDNEQVAIFGSGVAGRLELSVEIASALRGRGMASDLITEALLTQEQGTSVFAQVSPGNVASLRSFLAAGFKPICSEVVFAPLEGASVSA
jgi:citrate lyase synthetase